MDEEFFLGVYSLFLLCLLLRFRRNATVLQALFFFIILTVCYLPMFLLSRKVVHFFKIEQLYLPTESLTQTYVAFFLLPLLFLIPLAYALNYFLSSIKKHSSIGKLLNFHQMHFIFVFSLANFAVTALLYLIGYGPSSGPPSH